MFGAKEIGENPEKQCRLCLKQSREYYSLKKRFEDTPPVHSVIRTLLSFIEDNYELPQQVCTECTKELLHFVRVKENWVANQFALARQYATAVAKSSDSADSPVDSVPSSQLPPEMPEVCVEINEDVGDFTNESEYGGAEYSIQKSVPEVTETAPATQSPSTSKPTQHQGGMTSAMRRFSKTRLEYRCFICTTGYNSTKSLLLHLNDHSQMIPHRCTLCIGKGQIFHSVFALNRHLRSHHGTASKKEVAPKPKPTSCNDCGLSFDNAEEKKAHDKQNHFRCDTCDQGFTTQSSLNAHMKIHTGIRPHACVYCGKTFSRLFNMKDHMRRHLDDRSHACPICPKKFFNSRQVNNHIESAHGGAKRSLLVGGITGSQLGPGDPPVVMINENGLVDFAPDGNDDEDDDDDFMAGDGEISGFKQEVDASISNM